MLSALNSNNEVTIAHRELKNDKYTCRFCGEELIFKRGTVKTPHFSHKKNSECKMEELAIEGKCTKGESELHRQWKMFIKEQMEKLSYVDYVDLEVPIGNRIADVVIYFNNYKINKLIIEIQLSRISINNIIERSKDYIANGFNKNEIIWLMGEKNKKLANEYNLPMLINNDNKFIIDSYGYVLFESYFTFEKIYERYNVLFEDDVINMFIKFLKNDKFIMSHIVSLGCSLKIVNINIISSKGDVSDLNNKIKTVKNEYNLYKSIFFQEYNIDEEKFNSVSKELIDMYYDLHLRKRFNNDKLIKLIELIKEVHLMENIPFKGDKCKYIKL